MTDLLGLSLGRIGLLASITFAAGLVRGFSGFAFSATVLSPAVLSLVPSMRPGLFIGRALFTPRFEPYYKAVRLTLLIGLANLGLIRLA